MLQVSCLLGEVSQLWQLLFSSWKGGVGMRSVGRTEDLGIMVKTNHKFAASKLLAKLWHRSS